MLLTFLYLPVSCPWTSFLSLPKPFIYHLDPSLFDLLFLSLCYLLLPPHGLHYQLTVSLICPLFLLALFLQCLNEPTFLSTYTDLFFSINGLIFFSSGGLTSHFGLFFVLCRLQNGRQQEDRARHVRSYPANTDKNRRRKKLRTDSPLSPDPSKKKK